MPTQLISIGDMPLLHHLYVDTVQGQGVGDRPSFLVVLNCPHTSLSSISRSQEKVFFLQEVWGVGGGGWG